MMAALATPLKPAIELSAAQQQSIDLASGLIAPAWPLDQTIAVNPYWQLRHLPRQQVAARMAALAGSQSLMEPSWYRDAWQQGLIQPDDLLRAANAVLPSPELPMTVDALLSALGKTVLPPVWRKISDLLDTRRSPRQMSWQEEILYQISQFCAAHCQQQKPLLARVPAMQAQSSPDLYSHWLQNVKHDRGISVLMATPSLTAQFFALPGTRDALLATAINELGLADEHLELYCHALLLDVNGWASHLAWRAWHKQGPDKLDELKDLLAIRMAWELVLWRDYSSRHNPNQHSVSGANAGDSWLHKVWQQEKAILATLVEQHQSSQKVLWIWARALEMSEQRALRQRLQQGLPAGLQDSHAAPTQTTVTLQAVFCIDVRSEPMRRALERQGAHIETAGFAGFFGLPIACKPDGTELCRPQLPGLLAPQLTATPIASGQMLSRHQQHARWQGWGESAPGTFAMVESAGVAYLFSLLKQSFKPAAAENPVSALTHQVQWQLSRDGQVLAAEALAELVQPVLTAMGLKHWAPTVLLVGHGSHSANNLQAAGLDCGACGGQTGEVNVRVLAQVLNNPQVRAALEKSGTVIPAHTTFVAALHNTTTDHIACFDARAASDLKPTLDAATALAQQQRASQFADLQQISSAPQLDQAFVHRSNDWSQPRPEWGLANNKAFVIAPRAWTRQSDLQGRVFLHDYDSQADAANHYSVLELLMTAPMIVTHWINMQYNASMTDNHKFGSGNKLLHNAVGGNLGVFEGNAGDLRIGLARQSLHDGERWMHTPVRLAVYIAAPAEAIADIVARHTMLQELVNNDWIELYQWQAEAGFARLYQGRWHLVQLGSSPAQQQGAAR